MLAIIDLHVHGSCMRVAVRVLHSCAFITTEKRAAMAAIIYLYQVCFQRSIPNYFRLINIGNYRGTFTFSGPRPSEPPSISMVQVHMPTEWTRDETIIVLYFHNCDSMTYLPKRKNLYTCYVYRDDDYNSHTHAVLVIIDNSVTVYFIFLCGMIAMEIKMFTFSIANTYKNIQY